MTEQPNRTRSRRARHEHPEQFENARETEAAASYVSPSQDDLSAYYCRTPKTEDSNGPAFAAPPKLDRLMPSVTEQETPAWEQRNNVYRPRAVTWENAEMDEELGGSGYQVQDDQSAPERKKRRHAGRTALMGIAAACLIAVGIWIVREPLGEWFGVKIQPTELPVAAVATPEPVKAYDEAPAVEISSSTRNAISELSGTVEMETYLVTDSHVATRNRRKDGSYDFYLFSAMEGRLLCYFEGLNALDMIPLRNGGFYVKQSPWLVASNGSAMIRTSDVEAQTGEKIILHPLYRKWALMEAGSERNYMNSEGQLISTLWFSKAFPFLSGYTLAYVDTGSTADQRYLLYVLGEDGAMTRWLAADDMTDAVVSAGGMAYMKNGDLYKLPDTATPLLNTQQLDLYLDCDAMVVKDAATGKYGLFVHGDQHYGYVYDSIYPVKSDIPWRKVELTGENAHCTLHAVETDAYPLPLSHSFVLERDGQYEYVALSTESTYPILLDGEF